MARAQGKGKVKGPISLLLVEGYTDVLFWERVKSTFFSGEEYRVTIVNLKGLYNINRKVVDKLYLFCSQHYDEVVKAYCCVDRESREGTTPGLDLGVIRKNIQEKDIKCVLSVDAILATQQMKMSQP